MRERIEKKSAAPLVFIRQLPSAVVPVAAALLLGVGIAVRGAGGAVCLLILAAFLGWIGYISWPSADSRGRSVRVVVIATLVAFAAWQFTR